MNTTENLKQELIDHLHGIDKAKLSIFDLKVYTEIVQIADNMERATRGDAVTELMKTVFSSGIGGPPYKLPEMKEE